MKSQNLSATRRNLKPKHISEVFLRGLETVKRHPRIRQKWCAVIALAGACSLRFLQLQSVPTLGNF